MGTIGRYLRANKGTEGPTHLVFFDTESYSNPHPTHKNKRVLTLRLWCAISLRLEADRVTRRRVHHGTTAAEFWRTLSILGSRRHCYYCYAHNLGHDLTTLSFWEELDCGHFALSATRDVAYSNGCDNRRAKQGRIVADSLPAYVTVCAGQKWFHFVDTLNYWPKNLRWVGEAIGLRKISRPDWTDCDGRWKEYCQRDTEIVEHAMVGLIRRWKREDCGVFQPTAAGLSMNSFRHMSAKKEGDADAIDIVCEPDAKQHLLERGSYYGGRIQCFYVGGIRGSVYHLDVNSLYPSVMRSNLFPRRFVRFQEGMTLAELQSATTYYGVVARVAINSRSEAFPVRIDGEQYHCTGRYWTTLCGPELQRAIDTESIYRVGTIQLYSIAPLFAEWVDYWFNRKLEALRSGTSGLAELEFCKLILNSLSGKWAQHGRNWRDVPEEIPMRRWGGYPEYDRTARKWITARGIAGHKQILDDGKEPPHAFPAISAFITAYAREFMGRIIGTCPPRSVYYMATDSLLCDALAYDALARAGCIDGTALGKLKLLGRYSTAEIHGANWYELDGKVIASGLVGAAVNAKAEGRPVELWERGSAFIATGPRSDVVVTEITVPVPRPNHKGIIDRSGWWTPYRLTQDVDFSDRPPKSGYLRECFGDMPEARIQQGDGLSPPLAAGV